MLLYIMIFYTSGSVGHRCSQHRIEDEEQNYIHPKNPPKPFETPPISSSSSYPFSRTQSAAAIVVATATEHALRDVARFLAIGENAFRAELHDLARIHIEHVLQYICIG